MDIADERTLRVLEYLKVRDLLTAQTITPMGRELAAVLLPTADTALARIRHQETSEAVALVRLGEVPLRGAKDLRPMLHHAGLDGVLEAQDLLDVAQTLQVARRLRGFLQGQRARAPRLADVGGRIVTLEPLERAIGAVLDEEGNVRDDASTTLRAIRSEQRTLERRIRDKIDEIIHHPVYGKMLQEPLVTVRGDRFVVPVRQEVRGQFPGLVHDQSSSGATVFMEPTAVVPMGNRRRELEVEERAEVRRLLQGLSRAVTADAGPIATTLNALADIDLALAKAAISEQWNCGAPEVTDAGVLELRSARHPLLLLQAGAEVVPIDVQLGGTFRTLVITGPNTGGKTVTLKTLGLLTLMAQAGLHLPAEAGAKIPAFAAVFADIGDEQSIEQSLSTFSSHMTSIVDILARVRPPALVLLDEIGAGTDPTEGAALARAIIETLHARGVCTAVTTHYTELKSLAHTIAGVENASVEFDAETLRPTFRLLIGQPGRSNAFIIAQRLGLDPDVVGRARGSLSPERAQVDELLARISEDRAVSAREREEAERLRRETQETAERLRSQTDQEQSKAQEALRRARTEADEWLRRTRRELETLIEEVRSERSEDAARAAKRRMQELVAEWAGKSSDNIMPEISGEVPSEVAVGDAVFVHAIGKSGRIVSLPDGRDEVEVEVGRARVRVPIGSLRTVPKPVSSRRRETTTVSAARDVPLSLSLRGLKVDDAVVEVDRYLDEAALAGLPRVTIIHGKGTGALRRGIHEFLRAHPHVRSFRVGDVNEGGEGVTVVELKE